MASYYRPRIVDRELAARLQATGAVAIEGPKACGKTATARRIAASEVLSRIGFVVTPRRTPVARSTR